jgi:hypothetical protein
METPNVSVVLRSIAHPALWLKLKGVGLGLGAAAAQQYQSSAASSKQNLTSRNKLVACIIIHVLDGLGAWLVC